VPVRCAARARPGRTRRRAPAWRPPHPRAVKAARRVRPLVLRHGARASMPEAGHGRRETCVCRVPRTAVRRQLLRPWATTSSVYGCSVRSPAPTRCARGAGNDLNEEITPVEAGLTWTIGKRRREACDFLGGDVIKKQLADGVSVRRVGLVSGGAPARAHSEIQTPEGEKARARSSGLFTNFHCGPGRRRAVPCAGRGGRAGSLPSAVVSFPCMVESWKVHDAGSAWAGTAVQMQPVWPSVTS